MEREIDLRPSCVFPEGCDDPEDRHEYFEATAGGAETAAQWLGGLLRAGCAAEEQLPAGYLEDPFVLGFAFSFLSSYKRDWRYEETDAEFALEVFVGLFRDNRGAVLHARALELLAAADPDFVRGSENGARFHRADIDPENCGDDVLFVMAERRAKEHMTKVRKHIPTGLGYEFALARYRRPACYDAYFMDVLRERFPDKVEWHQSALERLPNPDPDDIDYDSLSDEEFQALLQHEEAVA